MGITQDNLKDNYGGDGNTINISLKNNAQLSYLLWKMNKSNMELAETFRDSNHGDSERGRQRQNRLYKIVWRNYKMVVNMTRPHLLQPSSRLPKDDIQLIAGCIAELEKPYDKKFKLNLFTDSVENYYDLLCRQGYFELTARYLEKDGPSQFMKG